MNMYKKVLSGVLIIATLFVVSSFNLSRTPFALGATNAIPTPIALFETSLASSITSTATTMTLVTAIDKDGNTLSGTYAFIIDEGTTNEEFVNADCTSTACTNMTRGLSVVTGTTSISSLRHEHRRGASVKITDAPQLLILHRILNGIGTIPNILSYTSAPTFTPGSTQLATVGYADGLAIAGSPNASTTTKGIAEEATQAEIDASTAAGGTGARLFINPSTLATSIYGTRLPSSTEKQALVGTSGTPSSSNKYVTDADTATAATSSKVARRGSSGEVTVPTTPSASTDATSKSYVDSIVNTTDSANYVLGESFTGATTPQPAYVVDDLYQFGITRPGESDSGGSGFGLTSGNVEQRAVKIIPRANVSIASVTLELSKIGAPSDNALIEIQTDSSGSPSGTPVTNGTSGSVAGSSLSTTSSSEVTLTFSTPPSLTSGTTYWVVIKRSGSLNGSNYYASAYLAQGFEYASFTGKAFVSSAWSSSGNDGNMVFFRLNASSGKSWSLWKTDSDHASFLPRQFFGFSTTTGSAGASATLIKEGTLGGFSGLTVGVDYVTSTTAGSITASGGGVYVGSALSATQILIPKTKYGDAGPNSFFGVSTGSSTLSTIPHRIKLPFNGEFVYYWNSSGSNGSLNVYSGNAYNTFTLVSEDTGNADLTSVIPYTRGQYINFVAGAAGGSSVLKFIPIINN